MSTDTPSGMAMMMNDAPTIGDRISQLERELAAEQEKVKRLREALEKMLTAAENIGGEHVIGWQPLFDACVNAEKVILGIKEAK